MSDKKFGNIHSFIHKITSTIRKDDGTSIKELSRLHKLQKWCSVLNERGQTLLQEAIDWGRKETFSFLLLLYDQESLETYNIHGKTALMMASTYATSIDFVKLLLNNGVEIDAQDNHRRTAFHLVSNFDNLGQEKLACFLYYNANPFITDDNGFTPFEYIVESIDEKALEPVLESLFFYTFDKFTDIKLTIDTVLKLALIRSSIFFELFNHKVRVVIDKFDLNCDSFYISYLFDVLLEMDHSYLKILVEKSSFVIEQIVSCNRNFVSCRNRCNTVGNFKNLHNLSTLLESSIFTDDMIEIMQNLDRHQIFESAICLNTETGASQVLIYLLSFGLTFGLEQYILVYRKYGYCELFKLMLHIGSDEGFRQVQFIYRPGRFIYDISFNIEWSFKHKNIKLNEESINLLHHFSHPKLLECFQEQCRQNSNDFYRHIEAKIQSHPKIPTLVELSRNVFRKFLVHEFHISNESRFYSLVSRLPISDIYKKIITFEKVLYT